MHCLNIAILKGSENYHTWKFSIENYLEFKEYEKTIEGEDTETATNIEVKAKSLLILT